MELDHRRLLEQTPEGWRICYQESDLTGLQGAITTFDIRPGHVTLSRTGAVQSQMIFQEGVRHESLYQLDVGALMVCVCARKIHIDLSSLGGELDVSYSIEVEQAMTGTVWYHIGVKPV